ncbi:ABC transporter ATP-binding protein/permease [Treponema sp. Marseille-Q4130]|uniref:ABC transporter ATP-binding protein/permease n=1 Tax=Treponema sp. Marseille-Q4130 TaxID=2766702 RepID=UPI0016522CCB|nr:ABC transporter ATP-binding protein/permease [Treponema sp. Marseille-Q4130]MBC6720740.1 ABC transporter ATP-binding protein/permease [Treponema sp. Marseille-Q4130]
MIKIRLIRLLSHAKKFVFLQVLCQWISLLCQIAIVFFISDIVQKLFVHEPIAPLAPLYAGAALCYFAVRFVSDRFYVAASYKASADVKITLRKHMYEKLLRLGASYRSSAPTAEIVQLASDGVEQLEIYFGKYLSQFGYSLLAPLTLFAVLSFVSVKASAVLLLCVPLIPLSIVLIMKIAKFLLRKYWALYAKLGDGFLENLQGLTTLKIYRADEQKAAEMDREAENFRRITMKVLSMQLNSTSVMDIMAYGGAAIGMIIALAEFARGEVTLGGCLMIVLLAAEFFIPLRLLGSFFHVAMNGMAASDKIFTLLDLPEEDERAAVLSGSSVAVEFSGVSFSYSPERTVLKNMSLSCKPKSLTAIVGKSGSGKSTIASLIMTRNKGYSGSIRFNKTELSSIREDAVMSAATLVTHESYIFKGTVEYNLRMGNASASEKDMQRALQKVNLWDFLQTQNGLKTELSEKGGNLSGGQRQRLALARALLHDSAVYIFDEATSNVDAESEAMIMDVVNALAKKKTVIVISHKLSNVSDAARIYMLDGGHVIESGTHDELIKLKGNYAAMYNAQHKLETYAAEAKR